MDGRARWVSLRRASLAGEQLAQIYIAQQTRQSKWIKFLRLYLNFGIKLNQDNPAGELHGFGPSVRRKKLPLWSHLAQLFNIYFTLKLMTCLVLQHDYNGFTLEQVTNNYQDDKLKQDRVRQWSHTVDRLRWLGNAYYEFNFAVEPAFLFALYINYMGYLMPLVHEAYRGPARFCSLRMFLDAERELALFIRADIEHQMREWIESSKNVRSAMDETKCICQRTPRRLKVWLAHARNVHELNKLATNNKLVPLNRTPEWAEHKLAQIHVMAILNILLQSYTALCIFLQILPRTGIVAAQLHNGPRDLLFQVELLVYFLWGIYSFNFYLMLPLVNAIDEIKFVAELKQLVASLTRDTILASLASKQMPSSGHNQLKLNSRLVRILVQYKLLKQQIRSTREIVGFLLASMIITMLLAPAMVHFQIANLSVELRYMYLMCCLIAIMSCDFLILPTCWLQARCMDLFRSMSYLLAHIDKLERLGIKLDCDDHSGALIYDWHTVAMLRREQHSPELAVRQFTANALFLRVNYAKIIGIHFYCGILLAPLLVQDTSRLAGYNLLSLI